MYLRVHENTDPDKMHVMLTRSVAGNTMMSTYRGCAVTTLSGRVERNGFTIEKFSVRCDVAKPVS